jgi:hypothetical protein
MSAIGREGGHSRGRARQAQSSNLTSNASDNAQAPPPQSTTSESMERPSYIGHERANDRGLAQGERSAGSSRNEREGTNLQEPFSGRGQI